MLALLLKRFVRKIKWCLSWNRRICGPFYTMIERRVEGISMKNVKADEKLQQIKALARMWQSMLELALT